jgi:hypothetical protein
MSNFVVDTAVTSVPSGAEEVRKAYQSRSRRLVRVGLSGRLRPGGGEREQEHGMRGGSLQEEASALRGSEGTGQRQADAVAPGSAGTSFEDVAGARCDAGALVLDLDDDTCPRPSGAEHDRSGPVVVRVLDEHVHDLPDDRSIRSAER